ncbi:MAG: DUF86 domain-containing protein [Chloroflexota bacterium]|nr:DUF86 domain-containing protein [Chloroflexota bacterium]
MTRSQRLYCSDILERIQRIEASTAAGHQTFLVSPESQDAVIYSFLIIGEAIKHLDANLMAQHPQINWSGFARFRDFLIHQYHNTEIHVAWRASQEDVPALKAAVEAMLASLDESSADA